MLAIDETGSLRKGRHSVGVGRQYFGTAGRIESCQIGVFAAYAGRWGHALVDRALCLPRDWAQDAERRAKAGVPEDAAFATKPAMARPAHFFAYAREGTALAELAAASGGRWAIEDCFAAARDDLGLDRCEARSWHGWHRHMSLVMAAQAFLTRLAADTRRGARGKAPKDKTSPAETARAAA